METPRLTRRRLLAAAAAAAALLSVSFSASPPLRAALRRSLSVDGANYADDADGLALRSMSDGDSESVHRALASLPPQDLACYVRPGHLSYWPIKPVWQASFPGSGARMTWILIEALTGVQGNNDLNTSGRGFKRVVTVKTHYPVKRARFESLDDGFDRAIVILRNPIDSIPSYFNLRYEQINGLPSHTTKGPNKDWIEFREAEGTNVLYHLEQFERFLDYWMAKHADRSDLLVVTYEELTDAIDGPSAAARIGAFLSQGKNVPKVDPAKVPCIWEKIIGGRKGGNEYAPYDVMRKGVHSRPYSAQNLWDVRMVLGRLLRRHGEDAEVGRILKGYLDEVEAMEPEPVE